MAVLTASDFSTQIVAQVRVLDPSFSGEIGTPERKMIDAVAQALAENQVDLTGLAGALDIDSAYGSNLDRFVSLFGFQRQTAVAATGFVTFNRTGTPAPADIIIPAGVTVQCSVPTIQGQSMQYTTTAGTTIPEGQTLSAACPIQCTQTGTAGNCDAGTITILTGTNVPAGVTGVTNPAALTTGTDQETDNALKTRFKNTWARNLAGTSSQYMAMALSGTYTTRANVIGAQSRYSEYIQVPDYDDAGSIITGGIQGFSTFNDTYGTPGHFTTAFSDIPYAKQIYNDVNVFVQSEDGSYYYRNGTDFQFNANPMLMGDGIRLTPQISIAGSTTGTISTTSTTLTVTSSSGFNPNGGVIWMPVPGTSTVGATNGINFQGMLASYTSISTTNVMSGITFSNQSFSPGVLYGAYVYYLGNALPSYTPNFTFLNVNSAGIEADGLQAVSPGDVVLSEFSYVSASSRNDINHAITNAVDVIVDGSNPSSASCVFLPTITNVFSNTNPNSPYYTENFRRDGTTTMRPLSGNFLTPLFNAPLLTIPESITINNQNYYLGLHYWLVHDVTNIGGSIRARDGIEWSSSLQGDNTGIGVPTNPLAPVPFTGSSYSTQAAANEPVEVENYTFDANIATLQSATETATQITTDALVHSSRVRYFTFDITVMYTAGANPTIVNAAIQVAVQTYLAGLYFGSVIQLSDILDVVHNVSGVDNVRWSNDVPNPPNQMRVIETDINGVPLQGVQVVRKTYGNQPTGTKEVQYIIITGGGTNSMPGNSFGNSDAMSLVWTDTTNIPGGTPAGTAFASLFLGGSLTPNTAAAWQTQVRNNFAAAGCTATTNLYYNVTLADIPLAVVNTVEPQRIVSVTYTNNGTPVLPSVTTNISASDYSYNSDFFMLDHELASLPQSTYSNVVYGVTGGNSAAVWTGTTVPGLIIRQRAQNTWMREGLS